MKTQLLDIALLGNPVLRAISKPIENVLDDETQKLFNSMIETLQEHQTALAFAAPQFLRSLRCFVYRVLPHPLFPQRVILPPSVVINPKIINATENLIKDQEGCLSIPGIRGYVPRHETILVQYTNRDNIQHTEEFSGLLAKLFQHEMDHLDGLVYLDRLESTRDIISEQEYQKQLA